MRKQSRTRMDLLLGLADRPKFLYSDGVLQDLRGAVLRRWSVESAEVNLVGGVSAQLAEGETLRLWEDHVGIHVETNGVVEGLVDRPLELPDFSGHRHGELLSRLYREILLCIVDGIPLPNPLVYQKPWIRDAAMVLMALRIGGHAELIGGWITSLKDPFDRNNGVEEPDNLGQALYLVSAFSDASHPLVAEVFRRLPEFLEDGRMVGTTDFGPKPVYQAKWLRFGCESLGIPCPIEVPQEYDPYASLFWMDRSPHTPGPPSCTDCNNYPYLQWAQAHFDGTDAPMALLDGGTYLTWEAEASQADYARQAQIGVGESKTCRPHSWHAAEAFLYLIEH